MRATDVMSHAVSEPETRGAPDDSSGDSSGMGRERTRDIVVATYNVHRGVDAAGLAFDIGSVLEDLDADIVALQEMWAPNEGPPTLAALAADLAYDLRSVRYGPGYPVFPAGGLAGGCAGGRNAGSLNLVVLSRLPFLTDRVLPLGTPPLDGPRTLLDVRVGLAGNDPRAALRVVAAHKPVLPTGSVPHVLRTRRLLAPVTCPSLLMGDFNLWGPVVELLLPGWRRAVRDPTFPAHTPHSQIDHVFVAGGVHSLGGEAMRAGGSDHLPLRATICVPVP